MPNLDLHKTMPSYCKSIEISAINAGPRGSEVRCDCCDLSDIQPIVAPPEGGVKTSQFLHRRQTAPKGENLFREGQSFNAVYAIKKGTFISYRQQDDGSEQVLGFHIPGELVGLDAIKSGRYEYSARALEAGSVCGLFMDDLQQLGDRFSDIQSELINVMSEQINQVQSQALLATRKSAEERLAAFLLNLSRRLAQRGFSATDLYLAMSRQEIANYLGLAVETVSRVIKRFQSQGLLTASGKKVRLLDAGGLESVMVG